MSAAPEEAREFALVFRSFLEWVHATTAVGAGNEAVARLREHLGPERVERSVVARELPSYEQVNLQVAVDAWSVQTGRTVTTLGLSMPPHFGGVTVRQLLSGDALPPLQLGAPELVDLPSGPGRTLACLQTGVLLVEDALGAYLLLIRGPERHQPPSLTVEVAGLEVADAQQVHGTLDALRSQLNVHRGQLLELGQDVQGGLRLGFAELPATPREDVVLPESVLRRVERHTMEVATHREALRAAGQHLKRGLLLYGPPGTGKTHTVRYLVGQLAGSTVLLLSGRSLHLIGAVAGLARELQPSVVVLEDVDLVAEDRGYGPGSSSVLFELLDAMDGAAADADLLFLLTTNRADLLEPALAARPGRVDVAVEIGLPDADARRRLFALYSRGVPLQLADADIEKVVERTGGATASFLKELLRRAVLEALTEHAPLVAVTGSHIDRALTDLLDSGQGVTRALLGIGADGQPAVPTGRAAAGHGGFAPPVGAGYANVVTYGAS